MSIFNSISPNEITKDTIVILAIEQAKQKRKDSVNDFLNQIGVRRRIGISEAKQTYNIEIELEFETLIVIDGKYTVIPKSGGAIQTEDISKRAALEKIQKYQSENLATFVIDDVITITSSLDLDQYKLQDTLNKMIKKSKFLDVEAGTRYFGDKNSYGMSDPKVMETKSFSIKQLLTKSKKKENQIFAISQMKDGFYHNKKKMDLTPEEITNMNIRWNQDISIDVVNLLSDLPVQFSIADERRMQATQQSTFVLDYGLDETKGKDYNIGRSSEFYYKKVDYIRDPDIRRRYDVEAQDLGLRSLRVISGLDLSNTPYIPPFYSGKANSSEKTLYNSIYSQYIHEIETEARENMAKGITKRLANEPDKDSLTIFKDIKEELKVNVKTILETDKMKIGTFGAYNAKHDERLMRGMDANLKSFDLTNLLNKSLAEKSFYPISIGVKQVYKAKQREVQSLIDSFKGIFDETGINPDEFKAEFMRSHESNNILSKLKSGQIMKLDQVAGVSAMMAARQGVDSEFVSILGDTHNNSGIDNLLMSEAIESMYSTDPNTERIIYSPETKVLMEDVIAFDFVKRLKARVDTEYKKIGGMSNATKIKFKNSISEYAKKEIEGGAFNIRTKDFVEESMLGKTLKTTGNFIIGSLLTTLALQATDHFSKEKESVAKISDQDAIISMVTNNYKSLSDKETMKENKSKITNHQALLSYGGLALLSHLVVMPQSKMNKVMEPLGDSLGNLLLSAANINKDKLALGPQIVKQSKASLSFIKQSSKNFIKTTTATFTSMLEDTVSHIGKTYKQDVKFGKVGVMLGFGLAIASAIFGDMGKSQYRRDKIKQSENNENVVQSLKTVYNSNIARRNTINKFNPYVDRMPVVTREVNLETNAAEENAIYELEMIKKVISQKQAQASEMNDSRKQNAQRNRLINRLNEDEVYSGTRISSY